MPSDESRSRDLDMITNAGRSGDPTQTLSVHAICSAIHPRRTHIVEHMEKRPVKNSRKDKEKENRPVVISTEVIEISSDEDEAPVLSKRTNSTRDNVAALKKEVKRLEQELQVATKEVESLKHSLEEASQKSEGVENVKEFESQICCDICSDTMWKPWILTTCGHTFCESCIDEWFDQTLSQHMASNPHYTTQIHREYLKNYHLLRQLGPQYSCPACRMAVKGKPTEVFFLKTLVHTIAAAKGERYEEPAGPRIVPWGKYFTEGKYFA